MLRVAAPQELIGSRCSIGDIATKQAEASNNATQVRKSREVASLGIQSKFSWAGWNDLVGPAIVPRV